jgi:parvulin-like peptidyl-prolyl isomerase
MKNYSTKKNAVKVFILTAIAILLILGFAAYFLNYKNDLVVAKINNKKIFKSEIEKKLQNIFDGQNFDEQNDKAKIPEISNLPKEVIEILVKEIYLDEKITSEAKKSKISRNREVKNKIADSKNKILRQAYIDSLIKNDITDEKISAKYVELSNELEGKKEYLIFHIVTRNKEEAQKIAKMLKPAQDSKFAALAKKYSIDKESADRGGEIGYVLEDNIIKEISEVISDLKKNEISSPVQTKFGWHLIKVADIRDAKALPFESVKDSIRDQLIQDKLNEINAKIIKDVKIEILIKTKETKSETQPKSEPKEQKNNDAKSLQTKSEAGETAADEKNNEEENVSRKNDKIAPELSVEQSNEKTQ